MKDISSSFAKSKLFKNTLIYSVANAIYSGLPLILLPFLVVVLKPEDYGVVEFFRIMSMILVPLLGLSTVQSIGRFYFDLDTETFKQFVSTIHIFQFGMSLLSIIIVLIASNFLDSIIINILLLCILYFLFNQYTESLLVIYRVLDKPKSYLIIRVLNIILELGILLILYFALKDITWIFRVLPTVISSGIVALIAILLFNKMEYRLNFSKELLKTALIYSTPLILHMLSGYILNIGDRFFIKFYLSDVELGNYAVAYQIGMAVNFPYTSFNLAWTPTYFSWMKEKRYERIKKIKIIVYISVLLLGLATLGAWFLFKKYILAGTDYNISNHIVIIVLIANIIFSLYKFEANYYLFSKATKKLSTLTAISALIALFFYWRLIPIYGIIGAAYSTLISFILFYILVLTNKRKKEKNFV